LKTKRTMARVAHREWHGESAKPKRGYWIKHIAFRRGQRRVVRVHYRAPVRDIIGNSALYYLTEANWRNSARETVITTIFHAPGTYLVGVSFQGELLPLQQRDNRFVYRRTHWKYYEADGTFGFSFMPTLSGWMTLGDQAEGPLGIHLDRHYTAALPGAPPQTYGGGLTAYYWGPPALWLDKTAFIYVGDLGSWLERQARADGSAAVVEVQPDVLAKVWTLKAGDHLFRFPIGQARLEIPGQSSISLPAASFDPAQKFGRNFSGPYLYVPVEPVIKALGGTVRVDMKARRLYLNVPAFWDTAPVGVKD
ncbi:MAG: hypothetical protein M3347_03680, partial [Armatimonadota bacterium]|nr:hypothetical protein [Armatimonadota bacterium]